MWKIEVLNKGYMMLQGACSSEDQVQGILGVAIFQCSRGESSHYTVPGRVLLFDRKVGYVMSCTHRI